MSEPTEMRIRFKPWMFLAAWSIIFLLVSYIAAVTGPNDNSLMEGFHVVCMGVFLLGAAGAGLGAFVTWSDE